MNERIAKLIEECTDRHFSEGVGGFETFDKEKFALLIVKECAGIDFRHKIGLTSDQDYEVSNAIKKHFGVEE